MQAVIFDIDGLMIDTEKIYWGAGRRIAREHGKEVKDETLGRMMGRSPISSMQVFATELGLADSPEDLVEQREAIVLSEMRQGVDPMPGLFHVLEELSACF